MNNKKLLFKYIIALFVAIVFVISCFFLPEITEFINRGAEVNYSYQTNKVNFTSSKNLPYAMRFTEMFSSGIPSSSAANLKAKDAQEKAEAFFYSIDLWKYGYDLEFISATPKLCEIITGEKEIVWEVKFFSEALNSYIVFAVNDSAGIVIGFYVCNQNTGGAGHQYLMRDFNFYLDKYLPSISRYYQWSTFSGRDDSVFDGKITYKITFVDKYGNYSTIMLYYDYRYGNIIFNMEENILEPYNNGYAEYVETVIEAEN